MDPLKFEFGQGNILITQLHNEDNSEVGLGFKHTDKIYQVGQNLHVPEDYDVNLEEVIFSYDSIEAIDVLINILNALKTTLNSNR